MLLTVRPESSAPIPAARRLLAGLVASAWLSGPAWGAEPTAPAAPAAGASAVSLRPSIRPDGSVNTDGGENSPVVLTARELRTQLDAETRALGDVELRRGGLLLTADTLRYLTTSKLVIAEGQVTLTSGGDSFAGTQAQLQLDSRTGHVLSPRYYFARTRAGGQAARIDFVGPQKLTATAANYSSCSREDGQEPGWELRMDRLDLNFEANEGRAEGAELRFLGVPILAAPVLSFPASDAPKSGWLPPTIDPFDSRSGFGLIVPYYWRIAPNYDLTVMPTLATRRGVGLQTEYRYLMPTDVGHLDLHWLPEDRTVGRRRYSVEAGHEGTVSGGFSYGLNWQDASDDRYWKDFSSILPSLTQRLLSQQANAEQRWSSAAADVTLYARVQAWRVLQDLDAPIEVPYQRVPQLGVHLTSSLPSGIELDTSLEANRFVLNDRAAGDVRSDGDRLHWLGALSRPMELGWGWLIPKLAVNAASYELSQPVSDGRIRISRVIPTASLDAGLRFERDVNWFGRSFLQTLEPRVHYVRTPWRDQSQLPLFDTAASDFNAVSIYADSEFTGIDRVNDAHQATIGATTRVLDSRNGIERLRFGVAQRFQFEDQQLNSDGASSNGRVSDLLMFASGVLSSAWRMDTTVQYNQDTSRTVRAIMSARYQPAPFHTLAGTYRYTQDLTRQFELGYQWPVFRGAGASTSDGSCQGSLYAVGRVNYSMKDRRLTDSLMGLEYDAGCWIARVVAKRVSTGQTEATNRLMIQLELLGLSRLGSNPLKVLKDNIPGYRLLRDDAAAPLSTVNP